MHEISDSVPISLEEVSMEHLSEILSFIGGLLSGFTLKIVIDRSSKNKVNQIRNTVGGDMAGRDIHKK